MTSSPVRPGAQVTFFAVGQGADEIVLVGSPRTGDTVGAVLWVDRGWWRIAAALSLPGPARYNGAVGVFGGPGLIDRERMSWTALPASVRADPPAGPAWGPLPVFEGPPELADMVLRFDRRNDGWVITEVAMRPVPAAGEAFLVPD